MPEARFTDLHRAITAHDTDRWGFARRVPTVEFATEPGALQAMERGELILRHQDRSGVPVTYELSPLLADFLARSISPAAAWLRHHDTPIDRVGARHRRRRDEHE
ncbi:MAG: hypothetical protein ACRDRL_15005 [Sciscionella sp.]